MTSMKKGGKTGWPPGMLQDDCHALSKWLASKPEARFLARKAAEEHKQRSRNETHSTSAADD